MTYCGLFYQCKPCESVQPVLEQAVIIGLAGNGFMRPFAGFVQPGLRNGILSLCSRHTIS